MIDYVEFKSGSDSQFCSRRLVADLAANSMYLLFKWL
jgi:hypothetical protein